ncbi:glycosyltransferase family 4 protein [Candidatus Nitrospira bockiana]
MRVGIDANPILRSRGGIGWHSYYLLRALMELKEDDLEVIAYAEPGCLPHEVLKEPWAQNSRIQWRAAGRWAMRWRGSLDRLDVFHGPNFKMPTAGRYGGVVTIHDIWLARYPQYSRKLFGQWLASRRTRRTAARARKIITVSEYSARDLHELYGVPKDKLVVIHNGVSERFHPDPDPEKLAGLRRRFGWSSDQFLLFVGGADPRKNHKAVVEAYRRQAEALKDYALVLVGTPTHRYADLGDTIATSGLGGRIVSTGPLSAEELRLLYSHAALFVFPSIYEGFGMPVLEAMACGAPVVTSNTTALPEVAGDAAILVTPTDVEELAQAMLGVVNDATLRARLRAKGLERVKAFTWEKAARQTLRVYREVCRGVTE